MIRAFLVAQLVKNLPAIQEKESERKVAQSCLTLCDPLYFSLPGSSVHGIFQTRVLAWVAISFSRGLPDPVIKPRSPTLQADALPSEPPVKYSWNSGDPGSIPGWGRSPEKEVASVFLFGKSHGQRRLVGYSLWDLKELDTTYRLNQHRK